MARSRAAPLSPSYTITGDVTRLGARSPPAHKFIAGLRTLAMRSSVRKLREVRTRLATDSQLLAFQEGRSTALPEFYFRKVTDRIGRYAELLSRVDLNPAPAAYGDDSRQVSAAGVSKHGAG